ncbi:MAG: hypothetical protein PHW62_01880, partial [Candidatus Ratteibacteria bacterium]|nr:hypothetical protein [Candidatus Ratteibacteria bacterium]
VILVVWGALAKILDLNTFFAFIALMVLSQVLVSLLSIFAFIRDQKVFNLRYVFYLVVLSFLEFFCYRWILAIAKVSGFYSYFRGVRTYDQYERVSP